MSNLVSHNKPGSPSNNGDDVKITTDDHFEARDKGSAEDVAAGKTAQPKRAARTFVTLDIKPWGMLVETDKPDHH
jgi:hypothetical protein